MYLQKLNRASEGHLKSLKRELSNRQEEISHNKVETCESNMYIEKLEAEIQETRKQLHLKIEESLFNKIVHLKESFSLTISLSLLYNLSRPV